MFSVHSQFIAKRVKKKKTEQIMFIFMIEVNLVVPFQCFFKWILDLILNVSPRMCNIRELWILQILVYCFYWNSRDGEFIKSGFAFNVGGVANCASSGRERNWG